MTEPLIISVIKHYHPEWELPTDDGKDWVKTLCPFHSESNKSASVSYVHNAYRCHGCAVKGSAVGIIMIMEEVSYPEAVRIAEEISPDGYREVQIEPRRKRGRAVFGQQRVEPAVDTEQVRTGIRRRSTPWS